MNTKRKTIFPISFYQGQLENNEKLKKELLPHIDSTKFRANGNFITDKIITTYGQEDVNQFLYQSSELKRQYYDMIKSFCGDDYRIGVSDLWYNYFHNEEYHELHDHVSDSIDKQCQFACVHYLCYDKEVHKPVYFLDPIHLLRKHSVEFDSHDYTEEFWPDINEGDLIMFPSYLLHRVEASKPTPNNPRITISFNIELFLD